MASTIFSGSSRFSNDFTSVINRAVAIASLPLTQMQQQQVKLQDKGAALSTLDQKVAALATSLSALSNAFGTNALQVTSSDGAALRPTVTEGAVEASYSIKVDDLGSATTFVASGFPATPDPQSGTYTTQSSLTLVIDNDPTDGDPEPQTISLSPADHSLQALVTEINKKASGNVRATIVNLGTSTAPNYQLSLQSTKLGSIDLTLKDGAAVSSNAAGQRGSMATYTVNGAQVVTDSRTVTLAPGVAVDLLKQTTSSATLTLTRSTNSLKASISSFITAFNDTVTESDKHRGNKEAALSGDSILGAVNGALRRIVDTEFGSGSIKSLSDLGVQFERSGKLSLNSSIFESSTKDKFDELKSFIGSSSTSGWLKSVDGVLKSLEDEDTGTLKAVIKVNEAAIKTQTDRANEQQDRIDRLQKDLERRMAAADAMIAGLEQQAEYFNGMWAAMKTASESNR